MFTNKQLKNLIIPLIVELFLNVLVGMADTLMVSQVGEFATGGVSLVDTVARLLIQVFTALATGGAVIAANYIGKKDAEQASRAGEQLLLITALAGLFFTVICVFGRELILDLIYGTIAADVKESAMIYFLITAFSYVFLAVYSGGSALSRAQGNSKIVMKISMIMNVINVAGNALLVMVFHMGTAGVAIPTLLCRIFGAAAIVAVLRRPDQPIRIFRSGAIRSAFRFNRSLITEILKIGIPSGIDGSLFEVGRILVSSLVSSLGTSMIAANAVAWAMIGVTVLPGTAIGHALLTVVGQCMGANEKDQAMNYVKKLFRWSHLLILCTGALLCVSLPWLLKLYNLSPEAYHSAEMILFTFSVLSVIYWPEANIMQNTLRAGGDATFAMAVSITSMFLFRVASAYLFVKVFDFGLYGVWGAMYVDWVGRAICFLIRFGSRKWMKLNNGSGQA